MTAKIELEGLPCTPEEFAQAVEMTIAALSEYDAHLVGVRLDAANPNLADDQRRIAFPGPGVPELVAGAIRVEEHAGGRRYIADYELVGPSLEVRKQRLSEQVAKLAREAMEAITPARKRAYLGMREHEIRSADAEKFAARSDEHETFDVASVRPADDTAFLDEQARRREAEARIALQEAKAQYDIEDLTEDTIGQWKAPFSG